MSIRFRAALAGVLAIVVCAPPAAFAQAPTGSARPYQGLFGGAGEDVNARQTLNLSISLVEAYDNNLLGDAGAAVRPTVLQASGFYTSLTPTLDLQARGRRVQLVAAAGSNVRYYSDLGQLTALNHHVTAGLTAQLARRTSLFVHETVSYTPASLFGLFASVATPAAGEVAAPTSDYSATSNRSLMYVTNAGLTRGFGTRSSLSFSSNFRQTNFVSNAQGFSDLQSYHVGGRFTYGISRDGALRLGYMYGRAEYSDVLRPIQHNIDIGVDYRWPLSRTRRTTLEFSGGSTVVSGPLPGADSGEITNQYRVLGDATLTHQIGRTWRLRGVYRRGVGFADGLTGPVFTDALTVTTDGFLNRRTDVMATAAYTDGEATFTVGGSDFRTYTGDVRVRFAVSRTWATYVEYLYYLYDFNRSVHLPPGLSPSLTRNGVRVGLTLWVPVRRR